jgi:formylglycine-generating enzyme required for sulfatase activity
MGYDVFVSHSAKNKTAADAIVAALEQAGVRCWVAPRDINPGEKWAEGILRGIASCKLMLLVFSSHANSSEQVQREIERAVNRGLPVLPLRIEDVTPSGSLEFFLGACHWLDAMTPPFERHLAGLVIKVRLLLGAENAAAVKPAAPLIPSQARRAPRAGKWAAAAIVVVLAIAGGWLASGAWKQFLSRSTPVPFAALPNNPPAAPGIQTQLAPLAPAKSYPVQPTASHDQRIAAMRDEYLDGLLTLEQYQLGQSLLAEDKPSEYDTDRLAQFNNVLEGRLVAEKLQRALDAIPTPQQRAEAAKQAKIAELLATAHAEENDDARAQAAINGVLALDASNSDAIQLKQMIADRLQREDDARAAAEKQAKISQLLATSHANDDKDHGRTALAALNDLLALDPGNREALDLKRKISGYYPPSKVGDSWANSLDMTLAYIPAGDFLMGSPASEVGRFDSETQHRVTLTKHFLMATTHVTRGQFAAFVNDSGYQTDAEKEGHAFTFHGTEFTDTKGASWRNPGFDQGDDHPVVEVSWNDAKAFCDWLSKKEGMKYRLPTEAEWEYACRAGSKTAYPWGDKAEDGKGWANCADLTTKEKFPTLATFNWSDGFAFTSPVGIYNANDWGLYDMVGNAAEWCSDWYGAYPAGDATDPQGTNNGLARVVRGGSWFSGPRTCRCANRTSRAPDYRGVSFGFRVVLDSD